MKKFLLLLLGLTASLVYAQTPIIVAGGGGNLQWAIDNLAVAGDVLSVGPGTYSPITTGNKAITIISTDGADATIIDANWAGRCATLGGSGENATVLDGFTLMRGNLNASGGGAQGGTLINCKLLDNSAVGGQGGGAYFSVLNNCLLARNTAAHGGGAFDCTLNNCTVYGNTAPYGAGVDSCTVANSIVWGNGADNHKDSTFRYSCTTPLADGTGNIAMTPNFVNVALNDFQLQSGSPCMDKGDDAVVTWVSDLAGHWRIDGDAVDMGAYEYGSLTLPAVIVTFDANGGEVSPASKFVAVTDRYRVLPTPTQTGYTFGGWALAGTGVNASTTVTTSTDHTLVAEWTLNGYTVTFDGNGATSGTMTDQTFDYNEEKSLTANGFTRTGYTFEGWAWAPSGTAVVFGDSETVSNLTAVANGKVDLMALWTANTYTVTFYPGASGVTGAMDPQTFTYDVEQALSLNAFERTGYTFVGWAWPPPVVKRFSDGQVVSNLLTTAGGTMSIYALWTANTYTVTFDGNGGDPATQDITQTYDANYVLPVPNPARAGYTFIGWFTEATGGIQPSPQVKTPNGHTLYAHWTVNTYTVTFDYNDADGGREGPTKPVTFDAEYGHLPDPWRTGYTFAGWVTNLTSGATFTAGTIVAIPDDHTLIAKWAANTYTVTFDYNDATSGNEWSFKTVTFDAAYGDLPSTMERTGYTFAEWTLAGAPVDALTIVATASDHTLTASWTAHTYDVRFLPGAADAAGAMADQPFTYGVAQPLDANTFTRTGYIFAGWAANGGTAVDFADGQNVQDLTAQDGGVVELTAVWTANDYTIIFNGNGATSGTMADQPFTYDVAQALTLNAFECTGYSFAGWKYLAAGPAVIHVDGATVSNLTAAVNGTVTLYAHWTGSVYRVTFDAQGGEPAITEIPQTFGEGYVYPATPIYPGYTFAGWFTNALGAGVQFIGGTVVAIPADHTLYAQWTTNTYEVTFEYIDDDGITQVWDTITQTFDAPYILPSSNPTSTNVVFNGWFTEPVGGTRVVPGTMVTTASDHTLYARWRAKDYLVIDLKTGTTLSESYPIRFEHTLPIDLDVCRGDELWLRRVPAGTFTMGSPSGELGCTGDGSEIQHEVELTTDFYMGVFEVTQRQWELVMGTNPSANKGTMRPVENVSYNMIRGATNGIPAADWPQLENDVSASSFMGRVRAKAGHVYSLPAERAGYLFDLPTEAQWEYACRAGTATALNSGKDLTELYDGYATYRCPNMAEVGRYYYNTGDGKDNPTYLQHTKVGMYLPNALGLYDMHGNVQEWCLDWWQQFLGTDPVVDPTGPVSVFNRSVRGGAYDSYALQCRSGYRYGIEGMDKQHPNTGFRLCVLWKPTYTVTFDANGGEPATTNITQTYRANYVLPDPDPTRTGYTFTGWYTSTNDTATQVTTNTEMTATCGHTLYAHWEANTYTITFYPGADSVTGEMDVQEFTYDVPQALTLNAFVRPGYSFAGWNDGSTVYQDGQIVTNLATGAGSDTNVNMYAQWTANDYVVIFDGNGGEPVSTVTTQTFDTAYVYPEAPTRIGYDFAGWFTNRVGTGEQFIDGVIVKIPNDHTLYAHWEAYTYWVHFNPGTNDVIEVENPDAMDGILQQFFYGEPQALTNNLFERIGYSFAGWATNETEMVAVYGDGEEVVNLTANAGAVVELIATWTGNVYTVTFDAMGGTVSPENKLVRFDDPYGELPTPELPGYTFIGWFDETDTEVTEDTIVARLDDHTLYAQWEANTYTVRFLPNGGSGAAMPDLLFTYDVEYGLPPSTFTRVGYDFGGWTNEVSGAFFEDCATVSNLTAEAHGIVDLLAYWKPIEYRIVYANTKDAPNPNPSTYTIEDDFAFEPLAVDPSTFGFIFTGWTPDRISLGSMGPITVTAHWTPMEYVIVDLSGGPWATGYDVSYSTTRPPMSDEYKTTKLVLRRISAGTYTMGSPSGELGRYGNETLHPVTISQDFYIGVYEMTQAQWALVMGTNPSYNAGATRPVDSVAYDTLRGSSQWPASNQVGAMSFMGLIRAKTGLTFDLPTEAQWEYACRAGTTSALNNGTKVTAKESCPNMDKVGRYWFNGGETEGSANVGSYQPNYWGLYDMHGNVWEWCLDYGIGSYGSAAVTDPKGPASGSYRILRGGGWYYDEAYNCRSAYRNANAPSEGINTYGFRVCILLPLTYPVTFNGNGGTPATSSIIQNVGDIYILPNTPPRRTGYSFSGWFTTPSGGQEVTSDTRVTRTDSHTLYAQWTVNTYTVTFDAQGGTVAPLSKPVTFGAAFGELPEPAQPGLDFAGWWTGENGTGKQVRPSTTLTTAGDLTLYAAWQVTPPSPYLSDTGAAGAPPLLITTAYDGFLYDADNTVRGTVTLNAKATVKTVKKTGITTTNWTFSAKAILQAATISFSGSSINVADHFTASTKNYAETLDVWMEGDRFYGTLSGIKTGGKTLFVDGARAVFANKSDWAAQTELVKRMGLYNVAFFDGSLDETTLPGPQGYLSLSVGTLGSVKLAGKLADGTAVSASAKLLKGLNDNSCYAIALYTPLYTKQGFISGLLWLDPDKKTIRVDTDYGWLVDWMSPTYGWRELDVLGGYFGTGKDTPSLPSGLLFSASVPSLLPLPVSNLPDGRWIEEVFPWQMPVIRSGLKLSLAKATTPAKNKTGFYYDYLGANPSAATLSYTATTGIFKGTFKLYYDGTDAKGKLQHKSVSASYTGAMIPDSGTLLGFGTGTATINKVKVGIPVTLDK